MTNSVSMDFNNAYWLPLLAGLKTAGNTYLDFTFGTRNERFSEELSKLIRGVKDPKTKIYSGGAGFRGFWGNVGQAWKDSTPKAPTSFWTSTWNSLKSIPEEIKAGKGIFKTLWTRMPLIGNIIYVATEIPNLFRSFTSSQGGILTGLVETVKVGVKAAGFAAGIALGTALGGPIGGIVGGFIGGWLASKITGKTFSEKQEEATKSQPQAANVPAQMTIPPFNPALVQSSSYQPQFTGLTTGTGQTQGTATQTQTAQAGTQTTQAGQTGQALPSVFSFQGSNPNFSANMSELGLFGMPSLGENFSSDVISPFNKRQQVNNFQYQG